MYGLQCECGELATQATDTGFVCDECDFVYSGEGLTLDEKAGELE